MNELREACKEFRKRFNGFNDQSDDYIAKHFDVQLSLLSEVLSSQAANREKDAEIERLKEAFQQSIERRESLCARLEESEKLLESCLKKSELDSLRASVGDKWIEIKEGSVPKVGDELIGITPEGEVFDLIIVEYSMARNWIYSDYIADYFTHYRKLAPPTLPTERE